MRCFVLLKKSKSHSKSSFQNFGHMIINLAHQTGGANYLQINNIDAQTICKGLIVVHKFHTR